MLIIEEIEYSQVYVGIIFYEHLCVPFHIGSVFYIQEKVKKCLQ